MDDERIEAAIEGVLGIAASNFPSTTDIVVSTSGTNTASVTMPYFVMVGILALAKEARKTKLSAHTADQY